MVTARGNYLHGGERIPRVLVGGGCTYDYAGCLCVLSRGRWRVGEIPGLRLPEALRFQHSASSYLLRRRYATHLRDLEPLLTSLRTYRRTEDTFHNRTNCNHETPRPLLSALRHLLRPTCATPIRSSRPPPSLPQLQPHLRAPSFDPLPPSST
jgi:hypothetical protein